MGKKTIVILHGWRSKISRWQPLAKILSERYKVYLPVLPGFGKQKLSYAWNLTDYTNWFDDYLKENKILDPILIAHSNGGRLAIDYIAKKDKVRRLVLISSAGIVNKESFKKVFFFVLAKSGKSFFKIPPISFIRKPATWFLYTIIGEKDYYLAKGFLKPTMVNLINANLMPLLSKVNLPCLILWGKDDEVTPLSDAKIFSKKIKKSRLRIYSDAGHDLPFRKTEEVVQEIIKFCR